NNRLSLIRVCKYAEHRRLLTVVDQKLEEFAGQDTHDVLLQKTGYDAHYMRQFATNPLSWHTLRDTERDLEHAETEGKHRVYRQLFTEPLIYLNERSEDEAEYIKRQHHHIANNVEQNTPYSIERYQNILLLVKKESSGGETLFPSEGMRHKLILLFAAEAWRNLQDKVSHVEKGTVSISREELQETLLDLQRMYSGNWSKEYREKSVDLLLAETIQTLAQWHMGEAKGERVILREVLFRFQGQYILKEGITP
ncbi:DUF2398 family protein, partial [Bacillus thuringiensis]|uniref:DUF2398 family protein n=1 Tax=Bacillus thuringiensis TaxID=1428 RepID=UPI0038033694